MEISSRLVVKEIGISEISTGNTVESITTPPDSVNAIAWSPDGNYIVMCGAYESNGARVQVHEYDGNSWPIIWEVPTTTSCSSADFSPDGSKFVIGMYWYLADGATAKVYETDTGLLVDTFSGPRPNNCGQSNNQCGQIDGVSWHPDGSKIVTSHTRNDEGIYFWVADVDEDNDGYNTTDQGDGVVMHFRQMVASGMIPTAMVLATIQTLQQPPTPVLTNSEHRLRIDSAALTVMAMAGQMTAIGRQMTRSNGLILMAMVMVTNITLKW